MLHKGIKPELYEKLGNEELLGRIVESANRHRRVGQMLLTGFEGVAVARSKSFGDRWRTFAFTEEEAKLEVACGGLTGHLFSYAEGVNNALPAIGIFDEAVVRNLYAHQEIAREHGVDTTVDPQEYGTRVGQTLADGCIAVYYFVGWSELHR